MAIFKCKMCGDDLNLTEGQSIAQCESCGTTQTVPNADNEKKLALFTRANRLRTDCDFDKAAGVYEAVIADFPEEAEAYWGLVLCKYGIEYVDDPGTGKKVPTCHRTSPKPILEDPDYREALQQSDLGSARLYQEEAAQIDHIQQQILSIVSKEAPYDIFICYKETDDDTLRRTDDSADAQDLYTELTKDGYRVFFARNTLKSVAAGSEYEPYIYAALTSAKVMLALGSREEYFRAVWVKNEWARFLDMMKTQPGKVLIPCYKNIDPYDMPRDFRNLQALNMGDITFYNSLKANLERAIPRQKTAPVMVQEKVVVGGTAGNKIASLLDRGNMALEDGDWAKADSFFEDVLNNDSKNAQAYLGKTLALEKCRTIDAFARKRKEATQSTRSQTLKLEPAQGHIDRMAEKYTLPGYVEPAQIRALYKFDLSYRSEVSHRKQQYRDEESYWANHKQLSRAEKFSVGAVAENLASEKNALFAALSDRIRQAEAAEAADKKSVQERYTAHLKKADEQAERLYDEGRERREQQYQQLLQLAKTASEVQKLKETAERFDQFGNYQDSKALADHCRKRAAEEQAKLDAAEEARRIAAEKAAAARKKRNAVICVTVAAVAALAAVAIIVVSTVIVPGNKYKAAEKLMDDGRYGEAIAIFEALGDFKDSSDRILQCKTCILDNQYHAALTLLNAGDYEKARSSFQALNGYKDSLSKIEECNAGITETAYNQAVVWMEAGQYSLAHEAFVNLGNYKESNAHIQTCKYYTALELLNNSRYAEALVLFKDFPNYLDSAERILECKYGQAQALAQSGWRAQAAFIYKTLGNYLDSRDQALRLSRNTIGMGTEHSVGLLSNGTVVTAGSNHKGQCDVSGWTDIAEISVSENTTIGLRNDGTLVATGENRYGGSDISHWKDIISVSTSGYHTVGLKADGTVVAVGLNENGECNVSNWTNIVSISTYYRRTVGVKADGTVVIAGDDSDQTLLGVSSWTDIVAVDTSWDHIIGLKTDGTVVVIGTGDDRLFDVASWTDIVDISTCRWLNVGITSDGSVVHAGYNTNNINYLVNNSKEVVGISAGYYSTIVLHPDGSVIATGENNYKECNVNEWPSIRVN